MEIIPALGVGHVDYPIMQPAHKVDALLAVVQARVFVGDYGAIEDRFTALEIQSMAVEIGQTLLFVPCDHRYGV